MVAGHAARCRSRNVQVTPSSLPRAALLCGRPLHRGKRPSASAMADSSTGVEDGKAGGETPAAATPAGGAWGRARGAQAVRRMGFGFRWREALGSGSTDDSASVWRRARGAQAARRLGFGFVRREVSGTKAKREGMRLVVLTQMLSAREGATKRAEAEAEKRRHAWRNRLEAAYDHPDSAFNKFILGVVCLATAMFILETEPALICALGAVGRQAWWWVETICIAIFTVELLLKLGLLLTKPGELRGARCRTGLIFLVQPMTLIDLAALVPFYSDLPFVLYGEHRAIAAAELCSAPSLPSARRGADDLAFLAFLRVFRLAAGGGSPACWPPLADTAPSACLELSKARAVPAHPRAPPAQLGSSRWPRQLAPPGRSPQG